MIADFLGLFILLIVHAVTPPDEAEQLARRMKQKKRDD